MSITLTSPVINSTNWGTAVNNNWTAITNAFNTSATFSGLVAISPTSNSTTTFLALEVNPTFTGALAAGNELVGIYACPAYAPTGAVGNSSLYYGIISVPAVNAATNANCANLTMIGTLSEPTFYTQNTAGGTVLNEMVGLDVVPYVSATSSSGTNNVTTIYGVYTIGVLSSSISNGLTVGTYYGVYIDTVSCTNTTITNRYGLVQADVAALNVFNGKINTAASTTSHAGLNIAQGVAPASSSWGDVWTTSSGLYVNVSGVAVKATPSAWLNYNGSTQAIVGSWNILSVTYNSAGNYTVNFLNALSSAAYSVVVSANVIAGSYAGDLNGVPSTTNFGICVVYPGCCFTNATTVTAICFGP